MRWTRENRAKVKRLCLGCKDHAADEPHGYTERWNWTRQKYKTHLCVACPQCGLYKVWIHRAVFSGDKGE
jgi:hypothetical protein